MFGAIAGFGLFLLGGDRLWEAAVRRGKRTMGTGWVEIYVGWVGGMDGSSHWVLGDRVSLRLMIDIALRNAGHEAVFACKDKKAVMVVRFALCREFMRVFAFRSDTSLTNIRCRFWVSQSGRSEKARTRVTCARKC